MKYLIHLKPNDELSEKISEYRGQIKEFVTKIPENALHCTIMRVYSNKENQEGIINKLSGIHQEEFKVLAGELDLFDESSLAIKLRKSRELSSLHQKVIKAMETFIDWDETPEIIPAYRRNKKRAKIYASYGSPYYSIFYNPHIAIAHVRQEIIESPDFDKKFFSRSEWHIEEFYLSKKEGEIWKSIRRFPLRA